MNAKTSERLVIVHNSNSSHASDVQANVFHALDAAGVTYTSHLTPSPSPQDNIEDIAGFVRPGDTVLTAAGDGTGNVVGNSLLLANQPDVKVGFLGYGNFSDMAATFNAGKAKRNPLLQLQSDQTQALRPLEIMKNDEHWRYALLYATLGWTALAAHEFDNPKIREKLQRGGANIANSLARLGLFYFKTRHDSDLPSFTREGDIRYDHLTDVLAVNGPIMAKIIRSGKNKYADADFLSRDLDVSGLIKNSPFLVASGLGYMPGKLVTSDTLRFAEPATLPVQLDGEYTQLENVSKLQITKTPAVPTLHVITTRR
jgi:hypothetical protein